MRFPEGGGRRGLPGRAPGSQQNGDGAAKYSPAFATMFDTMAGLKDQLKKRGISTKTDGIRGDSRRVALVGRLRAYQNLTATLTGVLPPVAPPPPSLVGGVGGGGGAKAKAKGAPKKLPGVGSGSGSGSGSGASVSGVWVTDNEHARRTKKYADEFEMNRRTMDPSTLRHMFEVSQRVQVREHRRRIPYKWKQVWRMFARIAELRGGVPVDVGELYEGFSKAQPQVRQGGGGVCERERVRACARKESGWAPYYPSLSKPQSICVCVCVCVVWQLHR